MNFDLAKSIKRVLKSSRYLDLMFQKQAFLMFLTALHEGRISRTLGYGKNLIHVLAELFAQCRSTSENTDDLRDHSLFMTGAKKGVGHEVFLTEKGGHRKIWFRKGDVRLFYYRVGKFGMHKDYCYCKILNFNQ